MFRNNKEVLKIITLIMAIIMMVMVILPAVPVSAEGEESTNKESIEVYLAIIDDEGKTIFGPSVLNIEKEDEYGLTALGALIKTDVDHVFGDFAGYIVEIEGIKSQGMDGWMYAVNEEMPDVGAIDKEIVNGDKILWYYSKSETSELPAWPEEKVSFQDVGSNIAWAKEAIEVLAGRGIISGTGSGQFEPNRSINRAEFAKLVVETLGNKSLNQGTGMFSDVDSSKWYADYIGKAFATGLIEGSNGKFRPMESITRNEVATILHRMQSGVRPNNGTISFKDEKDIPDWARLSVAYAVERGLIEGYKDNTFKGNQPMTRAEVAVVLYRYITMMKI